MTSPWKWRSEHIVAGAGKWSDGVTLQRAEPSLVVNISISKHNQNTVSRYPNFPERWKKNLSVQKLVTSQIKHAGASQGHRGNSESQSYTVWDVFDVFSHHGWRSLEISAVRPFHFCCFQEWDGVVCDGQCLACRDSSPVIWTQILSVKENADSPYFLSYSKRIIKAFSPTLLLGTWWRLIRCCRWSVLSSGRRRC